ncbi:MAG: OB-fold nucleic acid binding domain-containing protein, partial [Flavobacteriales bacterium]|nr:OB-fold nucleic acid binding domain-containing protein [Flavobacteriales bacterium]
EAFAAYAFNKSHSTCYSFVAFQTAYLKANYPAEYMAAVLTNNMNDIKKVTFFMEECRRSGVEVLGPDINESYRKFAVNDKGQVRFGLGAIKGIGGAAVDSIVNERKENGKYHSIFDVVKRVDLRSANKKAFENLTYAGAFDSFQAERSQYFFEEPGSNTTFLERILKYGNSHQASLSSAQASLFGEDSGVEMPEPSFPRCEPWGTIQKLSREKEVVGVYISGHPLDDYKLEIKNFCNASVSDINNITEASDKEVSIAGIVTSVNHRMTKTGKPFGIFTIEDYDDSAEIVLFSKDYVNFKNYLNQGWFLYLKGRFQKKFYREDEFEFKIHQMEVLQDLRSKLSKSFLIRINLEKLNQEFVENLSTLFENNKGNCQLKVMVVDEEEEIKVTMPSKNVRIDPNNDLIKDLEGMEIPFKIFQ